MQEDDNAMVLSQTAVNKNKLTSRSSVATDSEMITVSKHDDVTIQCNK
jgi:hypothetical protein